MLITEIAGLMAVFLARRVWQEEDPDDWDDDDLDELMAEIEEGEKE